MDHKSHFFSGAALVGSLILLAALTQICLAIRSIAPQWAPLAAILLSIAASVYLMSWLGSRVDAIWSGGDNSDGRTLLRFFARRSTAVVFYLAVSLILLFIFTTLLFFPNDYSNFPIQPLTTFLLAAFWFTYILVALSRMLSPAGQDTKEFAKFAKWSVIGAISLSIYFLLPFESLDARMIRAFDLIVYGQGSGSVIPYAYPQNPNIVWLQSTAIPTAVSLAFGFLTAYVTSLVWYEYYRTVSGTGLKEVQASRRGRDPTQDDFWFGKLHESKSRAIICGATLGGWFNSWDKLRSSLQQLFVRDSLQEILIILPEPGNPFFWQRRAEETAHEKSLGPDAVNRLARAIETLYLILPENSSHDATKFLSNNKLDANEGELQRYTKWLHGELEERTKSYEANHENVSFSELLRPFVGNQTGDGESTGTLVQNPKVGFLFSPDTMMAVNIFDDIVYFTPYLPLTEDKDCPKLTIESYSALGATINQVISGTRRKAISATSRTHVLAIAYRFWRECSRQKEANLKGLPDVPRWLTIKISELPP